MEIPIGLQAHPELGRHLEEPCELERGVRADASLSQDNLVQPVERGPEAPCRLDLPHPIGFRNSSSSISPGATAGPSQLGSLVIVFDEDFVRMSLLPQKRHSVLIVHPNTVAVELPSL